MTRSQSQLDADKLCGDVFTTASALAYLSYELVSLGGGDPFPAGLRDTLVALIERNKELTGRLVEHVEWQERKASSPTEAAALVAYQASRKADQAMEVTPA